MFHTDPNPAQGADPAPANRSCAPEGVCACGPECQCGDDCQCTTESHCASN
jgi:hypothetical protein